MSGLFGRSRYTPTLNALAQYASPLPRNGGPGSTRDPLGNYAPVRQQQARSYQRNPAETLGSVLSTALQGAGQTPGRARRLAEGLLDVTPVGAARDLSDAGMQTARGIRDGSKATTLGGLLGAALAVAPMPGPAKRGIRALPEPSALNLPRTPSVEEMASASSVQAVPLSHARHGNRLQWDRFNNGDHGEPLVPGYSDRPLAVQLENGEFVLLDGNHRAALANSRGERDMEMHVIPARQYDPANAGRAPKPFGDTDALLAELLGLK